AEWRAQSAERRASADVLFDWQWWRAGAAGGAVPISLLIFANLTDFSLMSLCDDDATLTNYQIISSAASSSNPGD
ncbi:hypothetical protein ACTGV6_10505, partial [Streptococcus suis]